MSDEFEVNTRLLQEDNLSTVLFNRALETFIKKTQKNYEGLILDDNMKY